MLKVCKVCEKDAFSFCKIKSFNKEMILAQVFAWSSMEGAIMVVICLLDAIKSDAPFRVSSQWLGSECLDFLIFIWCV